MSDEPAKPQSDESELDKEPEAEPGKSAKKSKLKLVPPPEDAKDLADLWLDPALGDGLTDIHFHEVPVGKPKGYFRVCADPAYRQLTEMYVHKVEGQVDEQHFIIAGPMRGRFDEAQRCTLVTCINRDGSPRLWGLKQPKDGERDNEAWTSARKAARTAMDKWVKLVWKKRAYETRDALPGYAPDPAWSKLPPFEELVKLAFGEHGIIRDENHPIARELFGAPAEESDDADDDLA